MARLLHLSDLHVVEDGGRASGVLDTRAILRAAIDRLVGIRPALDPLDAVLVTGDISDDGSDASYAFARAELERLGLPLLVIPGNHDLRENLRSAFIGSPGMPLHGPINWAEKIAGTWIIGLDTLVEGRGGGRLDPETLEHLGAALDAAKGQPIVIALHHPPISTGIIFMDEIGLENPSQLEVHVERAAGPVTVLCGHVHGIHHGRIGGHPVISGPSMCSAFALDRRPDAPVGFFAGPTGCAVIDTAPGGAWTAVPLDDFGGLHPF